MTLKGHYALCFKTRASYGAHHENLNEDRHNTISDEDVLTGKRSSVRKKDILYTPLSYNFCSYEVFLMIKKWRFELQTPSCLRPC